MLATLRIRNLALVPDLTLELHPGLNVLTGETGAGKSVILGAIQLIIGQRADRTAIRSSADLCSIEAVFNASRCQSAVDEILGAAGLDPCEAGALVIRRSIAANGVNRQFVNGSPTTLATLSALGQCLVDLHGPHEHQSLLQPARQLDILDAFGSLLPLRQSLSALVLHRDRRRRDLEALLGDDASVERQRELLAHQIHEIEAARLHADDEAALADEHLRASNAARILEVSRSIVAGLGEEDDSVSSRLAVIGRSIHELVRLDPRASSIAEAHHAATASIRDLQQSIESHARSIDVDPERLATLSERLNLVQSLRRKYGNTIQDVLTYARQARDDLARLDGRQEQAAVIQEEIGDVESRIQEACVQLRQQRIQLGPRLARAAIREMASLGFQQAGLEVSLQPAPGHDTPATATSSGMDQCEFLFAPNPGEPSRPLRSIASSGELARVMLALKTALAHEDSVPVLLFDEVDANVGGETAHAVGRSLKRIAKDHQVLCISHLAPVAAHADAHYVVTKEVHDGRTESRIQPMDEQGRISELGRMLGGGSAATYHARHLLLSTTTALQGMTKK